MLLPWQQWRFNMAAESWFFVFIWQTSSVTPNFFFSQTFSLLMDHDWENFQKNLWCGIFSIREKLFFLNKTISTPKIFFNFSHPWAINNENVWWKTIGGHRTRLPDKCKKSRFGGHIETSVLPWEHHVNIINECHLAVRNFIKKCSNSTCPGIGITW